MQYAHGLCDASIPCAFPGVSQILGSAPLAKWQGIKAPLPDTMGVLPEERGALMNIIAINGSHRAGQNTAYLLNLALEEAKAKGAKTELIELSELDIEYCNGCNRCLGKPACAISDDMDELKEKMLEADGIILGSPDYFGNVTARTKCFIDRTRPLHMVENQLKGKVGGFLTMAGLDNCGAEATNRVLENFFTTHEMLVVHPRPTGPVIGSGITGSLMAGMKDGKPRWRRSVEEDPHRCAHGKAARARHDRFD